MKVALIALSFLLFQCTAPDSSTILIHNATIIDGTGADPMIGSVRIQNDKIIEIGDLELTKSDSIIDGTGLVLSPGFIDTHSHHDRDTLRTVDAAISQGITTIIVGQDGGSHLPLEQYYDSLSMFPLSVNIGSYAGHGVIRRMVMGNDFKRTASSMEIDSMKGLLEREMQAGALGLGTGLEYDPGIYSNSDEVIELAKIASAYNGRYISHMRSEDVYFESSLKEIIKIGKEGNIPVQISHFKLGRRSLWGHASDVLQTLDSARSAGIDITADIYPYEYWQSTMTVLFPNRDFDNRESAKFALTELTSPEGMIINRFEANKEYEGLTLNEIALLRKEDPVDTYMTLIKMSREIPGESIIAKSMKLEDIVTISNWTHSNICSDGAPSGHPRGWGAFPRYLSMQTEQSLETKIQRMTLQAAKNLNLDSIGSIKNGYYADLVLFNPETIKDNATYKQSSLRASGIKMVMVSGKVVYSNEMPTKRYSGRILRRK